MIDNEDDIYFRIRVTPDGGERYVLEVDSRDIEFWERISGRTLGDLEAASISMGLVYSLAEATAKRQNRFSGTLAEFKEICRVGIIESPGPTEPDPSGGD